MTVGAGDDETIKVCAAAFLTVSDTVAVPVVGVTEKLESPPYVATMTSAGAISDVVVQVVWPLAFKGATVQAAAVPLMVKVTLPVGVTGVMAAAVTDAVKVTDWPTVGDATDDVRLSVAGSLFTVCVREAGVATVKFASPA